MATAAYSYKRHQDRHVSLTKLSVILANLALWASLIVGLALVAR
jgi:hypothetical protein